MVSWINLPQNYVNVFYLSWITVSKLPHTTCNACRTRATTELLLTETPELSHFNCGIQIRQIWIKLIRACALLPRAYKTHIADLDEVKQTDNGVGQVGSAATCHWHRHQQHASRPAVDILCTGFFVTVVLVIFCCRCWRHKQLGAICRPMLACCTFWHCDVVTWWLFRFAR